MTLRLITALFAITNLIGCASSLTMGLARPVDDGEFQVSVTPSGFMLGEGCLDSPDEMSFPTPNLDIAARYGLHRRVDVGLRIGGTGALVDGKIALRREENPESGWELALAPGIGVSQNLLYRDRTGFLILGQLPLLLGINTGGGDQLVFGARVLAPLGMIPTPGFSLGYAAHCESCGGMRFMPEVGVLLPLKQDQCTVNAPLVSFGLSLMVGGD